MEKTTWKIAALATALFACSAKGGFAPDQSSSGGTGSSSGGTSTASSSGNGSSSGGSLGGSSGSQGGISEDGGPYIPADASVATNGFDAALSDADLDTPITLTMDSFTVMPNTEVYKCQQFGNPWGHDVDIVKLDGYMSPGSHHFFLFNMDQYTGRTQAAALGDCPGAGIEFHPFPYLSQTPGHYIISYPQANMGYPMVAANGLMMNAHYLNTGSQPITPTVTITIYPAKPGVVTVHVGSIFLNNTLFAVPAMTTTPTWYPKTQIPITSEDYTIITHWSHMHQYSSDFQALIDGGAFYDEPDWNEPKMLNATNDPLHTLPMQVKSGTAITWQCKYTNPTSSAMSFGDSAQTNVMCIYLGQYYPADTTSPSYPDIVSVLN
jgi:hypothetical protein